MAPASSHPGPYSLPDKDEVQLSAEDDWTRVKDRKEKKRIQNRVAQRSYRSRMKARLGELQSRLQAHEEQKAKEDGERRDASPQSPQSSSVTGVSVHATQRSENNAGAIDTEPSSVTSASPPTPADVAGDLDIEHHAKSLDPFSHQIDMAGDDDGQWFLDSTSLMQHGDTSSYIQPSIPTPPVSLVQGQAMSQYMSEGHRPPVEGSAALSQSILQDCLRFQMQLLAKINSPSEAPSTAPRDEASAAQNMMANSNMARTGSFSVSPADFHNLDDMMDLSSTSEIPNAAWRPGPQFAAPETTPRLHSVDNSIQQQSPMDGNGQSTEQKAVVPDRCTAFVTKSSSSTQASEQCMEERIEAAIEGLEALGFSSVDTFAEAYYSGDFDDSSHVAAEQLMSRKRRLPRLLSQILDSAQDWDTRERKGLNEEVLRAAESLLVVEGKNMDEKALEASISGLLQSADIPSKAASTPPTPSQPNVTGMKKVLQNEVWSISARFATPS
ncbi:basic-leucine zipper (bZIP) transcription factor [Purpureocillium lavendulum]|uniref:Basic-leucine zipper (BZIP) transcription factor n=1 Tax=Purpureocillium lavendulum TaxID=1247861 RepID=A0AB34FQM4_9HYPO|nr:basic-leucine zipper (bZIP) transcription factor [Purpureocillium lavendulum]